MVRSDRWWLFYGPKIVTDFRPQQVTCNTDNISTLSYGLSSAGYDLRLTDADLKIFVDDFSKEIDPKNFDRSTIDSIPLQHSLQGSYYTLPPYAYALTLTQEIITMPVDHIGLVVGKSTYARCGLHVNTTPLEPAWKGQLVLELQNCTPYPLRVYANEGIAQLLLFCVDLTPQVTYSDREGKYQHQSGITIAKVRSYNND